MEAETQHLARGCIQQLNLKVSQWPISRQVLSRVKGISVVADQLHTDQLERLCSYSPTFSWEQQPKMLLKQLGADETVSELANLLLLDAMRHPHIVSAVKDTEGMVMVYVDQKHQYYLAMQKATGSTLEDLYQSDNLPPNEQKVDILKQLASTLAFLEHYRLEHGDIHSRNIMVQPNGPFDCWPLFPFLMACCSVAECNLLLINNKNTPYCRLYNTRRARGQVMPE